MRAHQCIRDAVGALARLAQLVRQLQGGRGLLHWRALLRGMLQT